VNIVVFEHEVALASALARRVAEAIRARPAVVLGLPTGRTPLALYAQLRAVSAADGLDWSRVRTFNIDEFVGLGDGDPSSYRTFMERELFAHVNIPADHIGFLDGRQPDAAAECERYEKRIRAAGGIDLQVLGIGANGHVGFNEPGPSLVARTHRARLLDQSRADNAWWFGGELRRVPAEALSMGIGTLLGARAIVLMATGESKAEAVAGMIEGPVTSALPASFLQLHDEVTVMLDEGAASMLATRPRQP
jgi:glucosamine-6-phosphate deaminase